MENQINRVDFPGRKVSDLVTNSAENGEKMKNQIERMNENKQRLATLASNAGNGNNGLADAEAKTAAAEGRIKANDEKLEAVNAGNAANEANRNALGDKLAQGEKQIQDSEGKLGQQEARLGAVLPKPKPTAP